MAHANFDRFAEVEAAEQEQSVARQLEDWLFPPTPGHLDSPRAAMRALCSVKEDPEQASLRVLSVELHLTRSRTGDKVKTLKELIDLTTRAAHEQELFPPADWEFIQWLAANYADQKNQSTTLQLRELELLKWLARWGGANRLEALDGPGAYQFHGQLAELAPHLENGEKELSFTHRLKTPDSTMHDLKEVQFFSGNPLIVLVKHTFYLLRHTPPPTVLEHWAKQPALPVRKLSHRLLTWLRRSRPSTDVDWEQLCVTHAARPRFVFELADEVVRLRLLALSERDFSLWIWNGHEWQPHDPPKRKSEKPEILDDQRLEPAIQWLRRLDWFTPEPGLWVGDANEGFLSALGGAWMDRPKHAEFLGNPSFHRLFLQPRRLKPKIIVKGSGIDWLSVSAEWEQEGLKLTEADLQQLSCASGRFVKLPDAGWVELDSQSVQEAHEMMADMGVDGLTPDAQKIGMEQVAHLDETALQRFSDSAQARALRDRLKTFKGVPDFDVPATVQADLRPYQREGINFLCHLTDLKLGGILADDMGLGKTLQTLAWLAWLKEQERKPKPALVICPASVLHNWRREANRFVPHFKVLVLESGAARHNLRKQIPQHDLVVTNYALLRRDEQELSKFSFGALILDEAQFIKNPTAQVTQSVKRLKADRRLALTGTPLENRLLDLWSIVDFIQPGYLGNQEQFSETYEPRGGNGTGTGVSSIDPPAPRDPEGVQRIARRRLAAKLRPLLLRRMKQRVAKDLPERIEERRDCDLGDEQRKLYLAELRRSRDQVMKAVAEKGLAQSRMHVLAALTRLRQICCHPKLVGSDTASGKTETLFELLEPLIAEGQKVLVFSQFVQVLELLERECAIRQFKTYILTGQTKGRQEIVNAFQAEKDPCVFLLSLRAAGTGLNLTTASYVVLYDPWWNPAVEAQAIDRSHRIGQVNTVNAYRLIAPGTVEEKIWELQQSKQQTIADVLGEEGFARALSKTDLDYLFSD
jgi:superfamily II DNA or RNA helicase